MKSTKCRVSPSNVPLNFVFWFDGAARRVSLLDGESASFQAHKTHDEGWRSDSACLTREGHVVRLDFYSDGRDCDGRSSSHAVSVCRKDDLRAVAPYRYMGERKDRNRYPRWTSVDASQRDYSAEAMGY